MANRNPYFKFYPADFMGGVRGMSAQEVGVYTMLLCRMYEEDGPIDRDDFKLSTYCGMREATFAKTLEKLIRLGKITDRNGTLSNDRAETEISNRANGLENAIMGGKASAKKRQQNQLKLPAPVQPTVNHTDTDTDTKSSVSNDTGDYAADDPAKAVWKIGVTALSAHGVTEAKARQMIGKWRKDNPGKDAEILTAILDCDREGAVDPIPWIQARLAPKKTVQYFDFSKYGVPPR